MIRAVAMAEERLRQLKYRLVRRRRYRRHYRHLHPLDYTKAEFAREAEAATAVYRDLIGAIGVNEIARYDATYCHPTWLEVKGLFGNAITRGLPEAFLDHPVVRPQMVRRGWGPLQQHEEAYLLSRADEVQERIASFTESRIGQPFLECETFRCSSNSLGHLYYLARILETFPEFARGPGRMIEFGGGYGNFARIVASLGVASSHVVIDFPEFVALQYLFLRLSHLDPIVVGPDGALRPGDGPIRLVPIYLLPQVALSGDLFVSHFGLSETPTALQELIAERDFLDCEAIYLSGQYTDQQPGENWAPHGPLHSSVGSRFTRTTIGSFPVSWGYELTASR